MNGESPEQTNELDPNVWLDEHGDHLYRFAITRVNRREVAEDLVQETLLTAVKRIGDFEGRSTIRTWLIGILKHKVLEYYRKVSREPDTEELSPETEVVKKNFDMLGLWNKTLSNWAGRPDERFESNEFFAQLKICLSKLSERARAAFTLHTIEDLSAEQVCENLSINQNHLWQLLYRARMGLRECIEKNWVEAARK